MIERILGTTTGSIHDLAAEIGVTYATLYAWATGRRKPSRANLLKLAERVDDRADTLRNTAEEMRALAKGEEKPPGPQPAHGRKR